MGARVEISGDRMVVAAPGVLTEPWEIPLDAIAWLEATDTQTMSSVRALSKGTQRELMVLSMDEGNGRAAFAVGFTHPVRTPPVDRRQRWRYEGLTDRWPTRRPRYEDVRAGRCVVGFVVRSLDLPEATKSALVDFHRSHLLGSPWPPEVTVDPAPTVRRVVAAALSALALGVFVASLFLRPRPSDVAISLLPFAAASLAWFSLLLVAEHVYIPPRIRAGCEVTGTPWPR